MKNKTRILIFIEHVDREFDVSIELSKCLKSFFPNSSIHICSIYFHIYKIFQNYDIFIFPYPWIFIDKLINVKNSCFFSLNYEQQVSTINIQIKNFATNNLCNKLIHFSWKDDFTQQLLNYGVRDSNIYLVNKPYNQILHNKLTNFVRVHEQAELIPNFIDSIVVFVPLTCLQAFKSNLRLSHEYKNNYDIAVKRRDFVLASLKIIFKYIHSAANSFQDIVFILRPHPSVSVHQYHDLFDKLNLSIPNNIIITDKKTSNDWLMISDIVLSNYSSVLLDANNLNLPAFILEPLDFPSSLKYEWFNDFKSIRNLNQLNLLLSKIHYHDHKKLINNYLLDADGITNTAKVIHNQFCVYSSNKVIFSTRYFFSMMFLFFELFKSFSRLFCVLFFKTNYSKKFKRDYFKVIKCTF